MVFLAETLGAGTPLEAVISQSSLESDSDIESLPASARESAQQDDHNVPEQQPSSSKSMFIV